MEQDPAVARHVAECSKCRAWTEQQQKVWLALDAWEATPVAGDFNRRLQRRIETVDRAAWWKRALWVGSPFSLHPAFSLAAAFLVVTAVLLVRGPSAPQAPVKVHRESVDIEQVEKTLEDMEMLKRLYASSSTEAVTHKSL